MSRLGIWQCKKLSVKLCHWAGSSRGAREFRDRLLPAFRKDNPHLEITEEDTRGRHPYLEARYLNGNVRAVDIKNQDAAEILRHAYLLRSAAGKMTSNRLERHVLPKVRSGEGRADVASPSVQGRWTPGLPS